MDLLTYIQQYPYQAYSYSYPHKNTYRNLAQSQSLRQVWQDESLTSLFLYIHIPFCEMRCGFCNLFTLANPQVALMESYVNSLLMQIEQTQISLPEAHYARLAFGGGTPSMLKVSQLERIFQSLQNHLQLNIRKIPSSFEISPFNSSREKLELLSAYGIDRISMGVQSFLEQENKKIGRQQATRILHESLDNIKGQNFNTLNLDLIYGIPEQTEDTWLFTLQQTLLYEPEEIYIYPLYIRPLTGIGKKGLSEQQDHRKNLYRLGRDFLLLRGYEQVSMRMFRRINANESGGPVYCCQEDGMLGLGVGARSYTRQLHYSSHYAVTRSCISDIIKAYVHAMNSELTVNYGYQLDVEDQRRRYLILSLLSNEGLHQQQYCQRFGESVLHHFPELQQLMQNDFARDDGDRLILTPLGIEHSDSIGPWMYSQRVKELAAESLAQ